MIPILHKVNTVDKILKTSFKFGIEVDVRERNGKIIANHDPFKGGDLFENLLERYNHKFLAIDIKCEGIEKDVIDLLDKYRIKSYFLLGVTLPQAIKLSNNGIGNISFHFSELEPIETAKNMTGKLDWVWIDCFTKMPLEKESYKFLKKHFKICLGAPDLLGRKEDIKPYKEKLKNMPIDAVCTDFPDLWIR